MTAPAKSPAEHTPGSWQASGVRTRLDGQPMLQVIGPKGVVAYVPYSDLTPKDHAESHADAKLIAAAPDLRESMKGATIAANIAGSLLKERDAKIDALVKALQKISQQLTMGELIAEYGEDYLGDPEAGYDAIIMVAREALALTTARTPADQTGV